MKSSFTVEEVADVLRSFDLEVEITEDEEDPGAYNIEVAFDDFTFDVWLNGPGPFHEEALFLVFATTEDDPTEWATEWNLQLHHSTAIPVLDEEGDPVEVDDAFSVSIFRPIAFYGGIHTDALKSAVGMFLLDLVEIFDLEEGEESDDPFELEFEMDKNKVRDAIVAVLQLKGGQSARQIADSLEVAKVEVNSVLYGRPDLFRRTQASPPIWSLVS